MRWSQSGVLVGVLVFFFCCSEEKPPYREQLVPLPDGEVLLLHSGRLYRVSPSKRRVCILERSGVTSVFQDRRTLYIGKREGVLLFRSPARAAWQKVDLRKWGGAPISIGHTGKALLVATPEGLLSLGRLPSPAIRKVLSRGGLLTVSAGGDAGYQSRGGLFKQTEAATGFIRVDRDVLDSVFIGNTLYYSKPDGMLYQYRKRKLNVLNHFTAPGRSPFDLLGGSPNGRYLFGITTDADKALFLALDLQNGRIFMAPVQAPLLAAAISHDNQFLYILIEGELLVYGFQHASRGLLHSVPLPAH